MRIMPGSCTLKYFAMSLVALTLRYQRSTLVTEPGGASIPKLFLETLTKQKPGFFSLEPLFEINCLLVKARSLSVRNA